MKNIYITTIKHYFIGMNDEDAIYKFIESSSLYNFNKNYIAIQNLDGDFDIYEVLEC